MSVNKKTLMLVALLILMLIGAYSFNRIFPVPTSVNSHSVSYQKTGLYTVDCWVKQRKHWPKMECFKMVVPENYERPDGNLIYFPVVRFLADQEGKIKQNAVLHLGGGGPGGSMSLSYDEVVEYFIREHDDFSLKLNRDLIVVDPRGAGLSEPLLTCETFVRNEALRLQQTMTLKDEMDAQYRDYEICLNQFEKRGVDLANFHSVTVLSDIENLREALNIEQWTLLGVSYGAIYAQLLSKRYPNTVESMVLDSPAFTDLKLVHDFLPRLLAPYQALYGYCERAARCTSSLPDLEKRLWRIVDKLNREPVEVRILYSTPKGKIRSLDIQMTGHRFISMLAYAVYYGEKIYDDLPDIIERFEQDEPVVTKNVIEYANNYFGNYLLDPAFADLSMFSHYCYDDASFIDIEQVKAYREQLPYEYLKQGIDYYVTYHEACDNLSLPVIDAIVNQPVETDIPTLFLQGALDIVTPPSDVAMKRQQFSNSHVLTVNYSHSVLQTDSCAEKVVSQFLLDPKNLDLPETCQ